MVGLDTRVLSKFGWKGDENNTSAAYLLGLIVGYKARAKGIKEAILDIGLHRPTPGARVFAVMALKARTMIFLFMALYAAKALRYCDEDPEGLVEVARASFVEKLKKYVKAVYAGPRFADVVAHRRLPGPLLSEVAHYEEVEAKVRVAERLVSLARKIPSPHREYVEVLALQAADGLRRFTRPGWYVRSLRRVGPLCEEALVKVAEELGGGRREVDLRLLLKGFVIAHGAYSDLAEAVLRLALGESPCVGKLARLCRGGAMATKSGDFTSYRYAA